MLQNLKIRYKLMLMITVPLFGLLLFAALNIRNEYVLLQGLMQTETLTKLAVELGALSHELQKERGYSSGFLNTKGTKFSDELTKQREVVNTRTKKLDNYLAVNAATLATAKETLSLSAEQLGKLQETRGSIDALKVTGAESFSYYTGLINSYLDVIAAVATTSGKHEVMRQATAYYAFVRAKEESGKERATLNAVLAADRFEDESYRRIFDIAGAQKTYLEMFAKYASGKALATYRDKSADPSFSKSQEMRTAVVTKGMSGGFGIQPEEWFSVITAKINIMKEMEDELSRDILATAAGLASEAKMALGMTLALTMAIVCFTLVCGFIIMRGITKPLSGMLHMLQDIAQGEGDLTRRLGAERRDELGEVSRWFNQFVDNVHGIVSQLAATTTQVSASCDRLNRPAEQIATAAEEVACQSATVATAGEEMSATSNDISRNCSQAASSSNRASDTATAGARIVQEALQGMQNIATCVKDSARTVAGLGERSDQIGDIVCTIEDIADQTNLLALNAAIEAARAGEQGRGFAVVADEVRALAERTTRATKEIGGMIRTIQNETGGAVGSMDLGVQEVEKGMQASRNSGEALQNILSSISDVTGEINQIATAAEEQTAVTGEISSNMHQINQVVMETATGAHETALAAGELHRLAGELQQVVGRFKL